MKFKIYHLQKDLIRQISEKSTFFLIYVLTSFTYVKETIYLIVVHVYIKHHAQTTILSFKIIFVMLLKYLNTSNLYAENNICSSLSLVIQR